MIKIVNKKVYETLLEKLGLCERIIDEYKERCEITDNLIAQYESYIEHLKADVYKKGVLLEAYKDKINKLNEGNRELDEAIDWYIKQSKEEG